jgi:hypothetical protein
MEVESRAVEVEPVDGVFLTETRKRLSELASDRLNLSIRARRRIFRTGMGLRHGHQSIFR